MRMIIPRTRSIRTMNSDKVLMITVVLGLMMKNMTGTQRHLPMRKRSNPGSVSCGVIVMRQRTSHQQDRDGLTVV